jgi:antitoxin HicB
VDATRTYTVILEPAEEGGFVVHVPALPEVVTQGEDEAEALAMAKDAIELALEERLAEGEEIPAERAPQMRQVTVRLAEPSAA